MYIRILKQDYERHSRYINTCTLVDAGMRETLGSKHGCLCCTKALLDAPLAAYS